MQSKFCVSRLFFCLVFSLLTAYVCSYHGELINNSAVNWQYVKDINGHSYLALDVYAPSGVIVQNFSRKRHERFNGWHLLNYPQWFSGEDSFPQLRSFKNFLYPYFPNSFNDRKIFTCGWYTFIFDWDPGYGPMPSLEDINITYTNTGNSNIYTAHYVESFVVCPVAIYHQSKGPGINLNIFTPVRWFSKDHPLNLSLNNLVFDSESGLFVLKDQSKMNYMVAVLSDKNKPITLIQGMLHIDGQTISQVFSQEKPRSMSWDPILFLKHLSALLFVLFFVSICWGIGDRFFNWYSIVFTTPGERSMMNISVGVIILTGVFFVLGMCRLLTAPVIFGILALTAFALVDPKVLVHDFKEGCINLSFSLIKKPWMILPFVVFAVMLFYNFLYCFMPITYMDGSADVANSYWPNLNDYVRTHSFITPIQNSTTGIMSQMLDVLRTLLKVFIGDPGVLLLSFVYLLIFLAAISLTLRHIFGFKYTLPYIAFILLSSSNLFVQSLSFGKFHIAILAFLMLAMYSLRYASHQRLFILTPLFLGLLMAQYILFTGVIVFYLFIMLYNFVKTPVIERPRLIRQGSVAALLLTVPTILFDGKLIMEVGSFIPPGFVSGWAGHFIDRFNANNQRWHYLSNHYIHHFYEASHLTKLEGSNSVGDAFYRLMNYLTLWPFYLVLFLKGFLNTTKLSFIVLSFSVFICFFTMTYRSHYYYYFLFLLILFACCVSFFSLLKKLLLTKCHYQKYIVCTLIGLTAVFSFSTCSDIGLIVRKSFFEDIFKYKYWDSWNDVNLASKIFFGFVTPYEFLGMVNRDMLNDGQISLSESDNFDYAMLIRQYVNDEDTVLIVPVRFHMYTTRKMTARHALGSVIYQKDIKKIMEDLQVLGIHYLSVAPIPYKDYNPYYTPIFEDALFYKYFKLVFSYKGRNFYKIIYDGTSNEYTPSPYNVQGLPFVPMQDDNDH
ncbi:MAG: hypothetical protein HQL22_07665 [Candidatus Omnitrophica bacterium]|nr:hypothetical protein [Candidatus Omnitrophota bacterium]